MSAILSQTYKDLEVVFIDNDSPDKEGLRFMHEKYDDENRVTIIANTDNKGYAKAGNQGIKMAISRGAEFVAITNPDILYTKTYFEKVVARINEDEKLASITGKVYVYDFKNDKPTDLIDTVGLFAYKNRRIVDEGQGLIDEGQFNKEREIFGVSGACPLYRVSALEDVEVFGEYFDEDFFMYKEDVDLAWRFLLYGWKSLYYPQAVAYHGRGTSAVQRFTTRQILKNRKLLSKFQKQHSFRNQLMMQVKNELPGNFLRNIIPIMLTKLLAPIYMTIHEPYLWKSYFQHLRKLPKTLKKRSHIMRNKKVSSKDMKKWFKSRPN